MSLTEAGPGNGSRERVWSPSPESVRAAVEHMMASPDFIASDRARKFLKYVVEETLAGRSDRIKAFSVALAVFGRDETFDAQNDPTVRIVAGRLRMALQHYYLMAGQNDPVVIDMPKGAYVPLFLENKSVASSAAAATTAGTDPSIPPPAQRPLFRFAALVGGLATILGAIAFQLLGGVTFEGTEAGALPAGPRLLVLPFADLGDDSTSTIYSAALTDEIVTALARYKEITVFGVRTSRLVGADANVSRLHDELDVNYVLEGSVRSHHDRIVVTGRLLDATNQTVLWSERFDNPLSAASLFEIQVRTADEVASAIAQPYGIVFNAESSRIPLHPPDDLDAYLCTLRYYVYRRTPSPQGHADVRDCLERSLAQFPSYATAWALLAHLYLDEERHVLNPRAGEPGPRERAVNASREAVRLDPHNPRALQSLATMLFYTNQVDEAFEVGEKAIALTPNDAELLGQIGQLFGLAGRFEEGRAMLEQAIARNPGDPDFFRGTLALVAYMQRDYDTALAEIDKAHLNRLPIFYGVAAIIYAQLDYDDRARAAAEEFQRLQPNFVTNFWAELAIRNIPMDIQFQIAEGFEKAGMPPPPMPRDLLAEKPSGVVNNDLVARPRTAEVPHLPAAD